MKSIRLSVALLFFVALFITPVLSQTTPASATKIVVVDTQKFDDPKIGIIRYVQALKVLDVEFTPLGNEAKGLQTKIETNSKELENLNKAKDVNYKAIEAKREEGERLQKEYTYKVEQFKGLYERRFSQVMNPLQQDIGKTLGDYGKQKGFDLILDISKDEKGMFIWANMQAVDITTDFIKFYNNIHPVTTTTIAPK